jgi:ABC-type transport system substrate-binding protein
VIELLVPSETATLRFLRGEYDTLTNPSPDDYLRFASNPVWKPNLDHTVQPWTELFVMNTRKAPFTDKRVRQAVNYAIDKEALVRIVNGRKQIANGCLPPPVPGHNLHRKPYPHDPERARRLLAEAGYRNGFDILLSVPRYAHVNVSAESVQADLEAVGIRARIEALSFAALLSAAIAGKLTFAYRNWAMDFPDPWNFLGQLFHSRMISPTGSNTSFYSNPDYDRLLNQARRELDREKRVALYQRAEDILYDDCPAVWFGFPILAEVRQPYVKGYKYHPCRMNNYRNTWLDERTEEAP